MAHRTELLDIVQRPTFNAQNIGLVIIRMINPTSALIAQRAQFRITAIGSSTPKTGLASG